MTCLCCGKPGERAAWSDSCPNTYVCVDCKSLPARFEKLQRDANESNRILGDQCERAEAEVERLKDCESEVVAMQTGLIAALEAERADLIKINNGWAHEWDAMREERDALKQELQNIADADPTQWQDEVKDQFQQWAQSRARAAIDAAREKP